MPKIRTIGIWLSSLLICCGCHGAPARTQVRPLTTVYVSASANAAMDTWIHSGIGRRAGNIANTGSMKPALDESQIVIVERRSFARLRAGDIVLIDAAWSPGARVAHRLVEQLPMGWWITRGDANQQPDPLMRECDYAGAVVIAAIEKHTGAVKILDRRARKGPIIASPSHGPAGGSFKSHLVCSKEF